MSSNPLSRQKVLYLAWPIILSNISTPLLGLVDTAVIGNLGDASLLGAIAIGGVIFSFLYWGFGFLRMGTTALVSQAMGAKLDQETTAVLYRAAILGIGIGLFLLLLQIPIASLSMSVLDGSAAVEHSALLYFHARIIGAPFSLALLAIMGFLLGLQKTRTVLVLNLLLNGTNIVLDILFVLILHWGVEGAAWATVSAEVLTFFVGIWWIRQYLVTLPIAMLTRLSELKRMFVVNRDLLIRTLCLIFAFAWFTNQGASQGDIILASNAILMQFVTFSAFFLDGFALAAETLIGNAVGGRHKDRLLRAIRYVFELGFATAAILTITIWLLGPIVINLLTNVTSVRDASNAYLIWAIMAPMISVACYLLDGIFIGATRTVEMRNAMVLSLAAFLALWWLVVPAFGNHGLWLALHGYFVARALTLLMYIKPLLSDFR